MKTAFLINGFRLNTTTAHPKYEELKTMLRSNGYKVVDNNITWNRKTISEFAREFEKLYENNKGNYNLVIGNSFGAMAAFLLAPRIKPNKLILCSLSAFFKEDLHKHDRKRLVKRFGERRVQDLEKISADELARKINRFKIQTYFLYGEREVSMYPKLVSRVTDSSNAVDVSHILEIPNAGHPMYEHDYVDGISKVV